jgi:hypothetical protein
VAYRRVYACGVGVLVEAQASGVALTLLSFSACSLRFTREVATECVSISLTEYV